MRTLTVFLLFCLLVDPSHCFHVTRNTEIGLCTVTNDRNHPHKYSCLQGDRNYCCGDRYNQTCCSVDEVCFTHSGYLTLPCNSCPPCDLQFASQHRTSLTLITVSLALVGLLFLAVVVLSLATVFVSLKVAKKKKERNNK